MAASSWLGAWDRRALATSTARAVRKRLAASMAAAWEEKKNTQTHHNLGVKDTPHPQLASAFGLSVINEQHGK